MIKPLGVLLVLVIVGVVVLLLPIVVWGIVRIAQARGRRAAVVSGIAALAIAGLCVSAVYAVAPKGSRTIAQLNLPDDRALVLRHYRHGWFDYPKVRLYARDADGTWTCFALVAELVNPNNASLVFDETQEQVNLPGVGSFHPAWNSFIHIDGGPANAWQLPAGVKPDEDDVR